MPPLEAFSEGIFGKDVERLGGQSLKQEAENNNGIPDRLCWLPVYGVKHDELLGVFFFWAEWKRAGEPLKKHQMLYRKKLNDGGHLTFRFDSNKQARFELTRIQRGDYGFQPCQF